VSELGDLYQALILDHNRSPRNFRRLEGARSAEGHNPLCGDRVTVFLDVKDGVVRDAAFQGSGCAISTASASLMTDALKGRPVADGKALFERVHTLLTGTPEQAADAAAGLGKLAVFSGVSEFPMRVKCATLPWHTFLGALEGKVETVRTEDPAA
jgi:nitrogen fixation protein NifU and related proteins